MTAVVVVHGIGQQYKGPETLRCQIAGALRDGVRLAGHVPPDIDDIEMAFYGDLFRAENVKGTGSPADLDDGVERELALAWWRAAARMDPANVQDPDDTKDARGKIPRTVKSALRALSMSRFATRMTEPVLRGELRQVRDYLYGGLRDRVLGRVCAEIAPDTRVVVGHSLGSVVAYEALCRLPDHGVRAFVTLGSPLGIRHLVFERLSPAPVAGQGRWPGSTVRWTNICDPHDVVALEDRLSSLFGDAQETVTDVSLTEDALANSTPEVRDLRVDNGWHAHHLGHYLTAKATGRTIHEGLIA